MNPVISVEFAAYSITIFTAFAMQILPTLRSAAHCGHPEMIKICPDVMDCLLETYLDFEAKTVKPDDFQRDQGKVCAHEKAFPA